MGLYKRRDSRFYWMTFRINGKKVHESTKTTNKKLAEKIHAKRLTEIAEGRWFPNEAKRRTFEELQGRYMKEYSSVYKSRTSHDRDICSFKRLLKGFSGMTLAEITPARISEYKAMRQGMPITADCREVLQVAPAHIGLFKANVLEYPGRPHQVDYDHHEYEGDMTFRSTPGGPEGGPRKYLNKMC